MQNNAKTTPMYMKDSGVFMKKFDIPFACPDINGDEIEMVADTLRSGWITTGPKVKLLENKIANWLEIPRCVCLNSQTACAEVSLHILGIGAGDEIITNAYTYTASASVICHTGAKLVMVDCRKDSLQMDYDALEAAITEKTKAIIPIDIAGVPCDYDRIFEIAERKKGIFNSKNEIQEKLGRVAVVADAAHAFGADWCGKKVGAIADFTNFSFHAVKNFTTAEGGAMVWKHIDGIDDDEIYNRAQLFSLHGQSRDAFTKTQLGSWEYDVVAPFYKCNMTDITAAIGLAQFERYPQMLARRKEIIAEYDNVLKPIGVEVLPHYTNKYNSSGHLYITRVPGISDLQRREIIVKMAEAGISCNVHYKPLPMLTAYKNLGFDIKNYPNAYSHYENEITLPLHTKLTDEQVEYVAETYKDILGDYIK